MREIKFRGKSVDDGKWVYGDVSYNPYKSVCYIRERAEGAKWIRVYIKTVGQYTGLKDKNGREIYEGDLITNHLRFCGEYGKIVWSEEDLAFMSSVEDPDTQNCSLSELDGIKVVGNIHE